MMSAWSVTLRLLNRLESTIVSVEVSVSLDHNNYTYRVDFFSVLASYFVVVAANKNAQN